MLTASELTSLRGFSSNDQHPVVSLYLNVDRCHGTRSGLTTRPSSAILMSKSRKAAADQLSLTRDQEGWLD